MAIHVDILGRVNERQAKREADKLADQFEAAGVRAGTDFNDGLAKELGRSNPKVQKALNANVRAYNSVQAAAASVRSAGAEVAASADLQTKAANAHTNAMNNEEAAALATMKAEYNLAQARKNGLKDLEKMAILEAEVEVAKLRQVNASNATVAAEINELKTGRQLEASKERLIVLTNNYNSALLSQGDAHRSVGDAIRKHAEDTDKAASYTARAEGALKSLGTSAFLVARGMGAIIAPAAIQFLIQTADVAVTASQSILLLPAAAAAAGAGIGTLALATQGFADTMGDVRDLEKFNEGLVKLAPNAQQAALALRAAIPMFDQIQQGSQDAFFEGFAGRFDQLASVFGPKVEGLTTSIAGSMNTMISTVMDTALSDSGQGQISSTMDNIAAAFEALAPAAGSFTDALLTLTQVGSEFLPALGDGISGVAQDFANWVNEAADNGDLQKWIQEGIDAVKGLGTALMTIGDFIYDTFGSASQSEIDNWNSKLEDVLTVLHYIIEALKLTQMELPKVGGAFGDFLGGLEDTVRSFLGGPIGLLMDFFDQINKFGDRELKFDFNTGKISFLSSDEMNKRANIDKENADRRKQGLPPLPGGTSGSGMDRTSSKDWDADAKKRAEERQRQTMQTRPGIGQFAGAGTNDVGISTWNGKPFIDTPEAKAGAAGSKPSESEIMDGLIAGLNPADWKVNPYAGMPGGAPPISPNGVVTPGMLSPTANPQDVLEQQWTVESEAHDLEEATKRRLALEQSNTATAQEISEAKWKEVEANRSLNKAQRDLVDKMRDTTNKTKQSFDELGVALDPDLGLSKGLAGFAENMTRMIGNMIAAPMMKQLKDIEDADPIKGGFGLLGINGAKNMAAGLSPLLGQEYTDKRPGAASMSGYGTPGAAMPDPGVMPSILKDTGSVPSGPQSRMAAQMVQDAFGGMLKGPIGGSRDNNTAKNTHDAGLSIDIPIGPDQKALGDTINQYLQDNAAALGLKYTIWRDKGSYAGSGGATGFTTPGHQDHIDAHFDGSGGQPGAMTSMPGGAWNSAGLNTTGATEVFVVNMPGGGFGFGGGTGGLGAGSGAPGAGAGIGAPAGQGAEAWRGTVAQTVAKYGAAAGIPASQFGAWTDAIVKQIDTESSGNPNAGNDKDSDGKGGTQSVHGLLQYRPDTYANTGGKLTGLPMMDPIGQIAGALADHRNAQGGPATMGGGGGWSPPGFPSSAPVSQGVSLDDIVSGGRGQGPILTRPPQRPGDKPDGDYRWDSATMQWVPTNPAASGGLFGPGMNGPAAPGGLQVGPPASLGTTPFFGPGIGPGGGQIGGPPGGTGLPPVLGGGLGGVAGPSLTGGMAGANAGAMTGGTTPGASTGATGQYGGVTPGVAMGGNGGVGVSDGLMAAASMAAGGLDLLMPGAGQAAQTGMKLANRAIQFAGQAVGIGISGLMETFLPTGGSELANGGWGPRLIGGLAGAKPALPNTAGGDPNKVKPQAQMPQNSGQTINVEYNNNQATEDRAGADLTRHLGTMAGAGQGR